MKSDSESLRVALPMMVYMLAAPALLAATFAVSLF